VTANQVLIGVGLILVLAVGSQVLASRLKIPAIIVLLPAGFTVGAITTDVNPQRLLGAAFQPLVSLAVAVILYDAGQFGQFLLGIGVGLAGGLAGVALLWLLLRWLRLGEVLGTSAQLASVVAVAACCDVIRDDAGLISAIVMGLAMANLRGFDAPARRPFFETLVQLIIGVLFIAISATVTPASLRHLILPSLALIAILVLITRPLVAFLATLRTDMTAGERAFTGWMAPRGIVAAATASTFSTALVAQHIGGASKILPVTFIVIVVTVALYGLTAVPAARLARVTRPAKTRPLLVGGEDWVVDLGRALRTLGLEVLMWAGFDEQLECITAVLLLTAEDDFNALGSTVLAGGVDGPVYRLAARLPGHGVVAPYTGGEVLFDPRLTRYEVGRRYAAGTRIRTRPASGSAPADDSLLFLVRADGRLAPVTASGPPRSEPGDTMVLFCPAADGP
jgi:hypothetical protein